tara:strand:+ start:434624 stop:435316 length:693 start_codon:yes stop_codon:yes gene_type:complete
MQGSNTIKSLLACAALTLAACTSNSLVPQTYDGLDLQPDTKFGQVYKRAGADLSGYQAYGVEACDVAFKKNWLRDQNNSRLDLGNRVTQKDVDRIKDTLASECEKYFREALEQAPPYPLVDNFSDGEGVLILRPSIINLDISAPDTHSAGMQRTYTTQAGEMTLVLELQDGTTGETLVRIVDRYRSPETSWLQWSNSVTNQAEARRVLSRWARQLRKGLDQVTTHTGTPE